MEVLCEDIVDGSKKPTVPDGYVDKDEVDMNEDYMADWNEYNQSVESFYIFQGIILCWRLHEWRCN